MEARYNERIADARAHITQLPYLTTNMADIFYLTGFEGTAGYLLFTESECVLFADSRYYERVKCEAPVVTAERIEKSYTKEVAAYIADMHASSVALDEASVTLETFSSFEEACTEKGVRVDTTKSCIRPRRMVKDKDEIALLKENVLAAEKAFTKMLTFVKEGVRERDLALELDYLLRKEGGDTTAFQTIILFGERTAFPHGEPGERALAYGDTVLVDFGLRRKGYCSDTTRTFFFGKGPSFPQMKEIYGHVLAAHERGKREAKTGSTGAEADEAARAYLREHDLARYFGHGLGHGVGIEIHEEPRLSSAWTEPLEGGSIVTVEPGVYVPGVGGVRIEDMVIVTQKGGVSINTLPKDLFVL